MEVDKDCAADKSSALNGHEDELKENSSPQGVYVAGDLLWSKISGHPYWPCMVTCDPFESCYTKEKPAMGRTKVKGTIYHVQYFGDAAQRGWTMPGGIFPFEGLTKFTKKIKKMKIGIIKSEQKKINAKFSITPRKQKRRESAVSEAEIALSMSRKKRLEEFTFLYKQNAKNSTYTKGTSRANGNMSKNIDRSKNLKLLKKVKESSQSNINNECHKGERNGDVIVGESETDWHSIKNNDQSKKLKLMKITNGSLGSIPTENVGQKGDVALCASESNWKVISRDDRSKKLGLMEKPKENSESIPTKNVDQTGDVTLSASEIIWNAIVNDDHSKKFKEKKNIKEKSKSSRYQMGGKRYVSLTSKTNCVKGNEFSKLKFLKKVKASSESIPPGYLCQKCEKSEADVTCNGGCFQSYHLECLGMLGAPLDFKCPECALGQIACFVCKSYDGSVKKCSKNDCKKFYHSECLKKFPCANIDAYICPHHKCLTCYNDSPKNPISYKARLIKCFRCPNAYHSRDGCIAAGYESLAPGVILCPDHFTPMKGKRFQTVCNKNWCSDCGEGGNLILCDSCPNAYHHECLNIDVPQGDFFCPSCKSKKQLITGMIIWVKVGAYRWWPAKIINLKDVPLNVMDLPHYVGEFPIQYFGTQEYIWTHRGRAFPFDEKEINTKKPLDNGKKPSALEYSYIKSIPEATAAFIEWEENKNAKMFSYQRPSPYKQIRVNRPVGNVQVYSVDPSRLVPCGCTSQDDNPCGYGSPCLNRSMLYECHPSVCISGILCRNQKFQKREYVVAAPFKTKDCGWGLKSGQDIKKGEFIVEYVGDLIDVQECRKRIKEKQAEEESDFYFLTLDKDRIIDAGPRGNISRFMNHSCDPNCATQKWVVNGDTRIGLFATCDIPCGTELTFDYRMDSLDNEKQKCLCGSSKCRGAIGEKQKNGPKLPKKRGKKKKRKRRKQLKPDSECYLCKLPGVLVRCDRKCCVKGYHLPCLEKNSVPVGQWLCPWHCCDVCGKASKYRCSECPNSFCAKHRTAENIHISSSGLLVCSEHEDSS